MAVQTCTVSYRDSDNITHSVEVTAQSLYEAAVLGLKAFRSCGWSDGPGPYSELKVSVRPPSVSHSLTVQQVEKWLATGGKSPREVVLQKRLREILGS